MKSSLLSAVLVCLLSSCAPSGPDTLVRQYVSAVGKGNAAQCRELYPQCALFLDSIVGKSYGDVVSAVVSEVAGSPFGSCLSHYNLPKQEVTLTFPDRVIRFVVCPQCHQICGSRGLISFSQLGVKVIPEEPDYNDSKRIEKLRFVCNAAREAKAFFAAVLRRDIRYLDRNYPKGPFLFEAHAENFGPLQQVDLADVCLEEDGVAHYCHLLTFSGIQFYADQNTARIINPHFEDDINQ